MASESDVVSQHIGWLKMYVSEMNADNWRDMRDRCERQLTELSECLRTDYRRGEERMRERAIEVLEARLEHYGEGYEALLLSSIDRIRSLPPEPRGGEDNSSYGV